MHSSEATAVAPTKSVRGGWQFSGARESAPDSALEEQMGIPCPRTVRTVTATQNLTYAHHLAMGVGSGMGFGRSHDNYGVEPTYSIRKRIPVNKPSLGSWGLVEGYG